MRDQLLKYSTTILDLMAVAARCGVVKNVSVFGTAAPTK
jgi:hypothetical protein